MSENFNRLEKFARPGNVERVPSIFPASERSFLPERQSVARAVRNSSLVLSFRKQSLLEPEDARITGATRSLYRRLLALNLRKPAASQREEETYIPLLTA